MIDFVRWLLKNSLYIVLAPALVLAILGGIGSLFNNSSGESSNHKNGNE